MDSKKDWLNEDQDLNEGFNDDDELESNSKNEIDSDIKDGFSIKEDDEDFDEDDEDDKDDFKDDDSEESF